MGATTERRLWGHTAARSNARRKRGRPRVCAVVYRRLARRLVNARPFAPALRLAGRPGAELAALAALVDSDPDDLQSVLDALAVTDARARDAAGAFAALPHGDQYHGSGAAAVMMPFLCPGESRFSSGRYGVLYGAESTESNPRALGLCVKCGPARPARARRVDLSPSAIRAGAGPRAAASHRWCRRHSVFQRAPPIGRMRRGIQAACRRLDGKARRLASSLGRQCHQRSLAERVTLRRSGIDLDKFLPDRLSRIDTNACSCYNSLITRPFAKKS